MTTTLYSPRDVAGIVGVTVVTLCHWRKRGVGPDWTRHGRQLVYYPAGDLRAYIERVGPIPANMTGREKQTFFINAHTAPVPEPEPAPAPEPEPVTIAELADRLAAVERVLVRLKADRPERRKRRTAANTLRRKYRKRRTAPAFPY